MKLAEKLWAYAFVAWAVLTSLLYSALQANVIWAIARSLEHPIEWMHIWWALGGALVMVNIPRIWHEGKSPFLLHQFLLPIDAGLYAASIWHGLIVSPFASITYSPGIVRVSTSLMINAWNLSAERQKQRRDLCAQYTKLGRAMTLRETLQAIFASPDQSTAESQLQWWCGWALRSRLEPFRTLAKTVRQHWEGILAYFDSGLTSAAIEAINGIIQLAKRIARGFRNFIYFRTAAYLRAGRLNFELPVIN